MKRGYDSMNSSTEISSYRDQHFKVLSVLIASVSITTRIFRSYFVLCQFISLFNCYRSTSKPLFPLSMILRLQGSRGEQEKLLRASSTLYIGNLSFYTTEEQIYELFSRCGDIRRVVMGLDKYKKTPCGFCFMEYYTRADAENCMRFVYWIPYLPQ